MNCRCKPGDLALVVKSMLPANLGRIVRVQSLAAADSVFGPLWNTTSEHPRPALDETGATILTLDALCPDAWLRPLRDPGDEAVDETQSWKSVDATWAEDYRRNVIAARAWLVAAQSGRG